MSIICLFHDYYWKQFCHIEDGGLKVWAIPGDDYARCCPFPAPAIGLLRIDELVSNSQRKLLSLDNTLEVSLPQRQGSSGVWMAGCTPGSGAAARRREQPELTDSWRAVPPGGQRCELHPREMLRQALGMVAPRVEQFTHRRCEPCGRGKRPHSTLFRVTSVSSVGKRKKRKYREMARFKPEMAE